jgi:tRNA(fMet)-specific endonuclease VapC
VQGYLLDTNIVSYWFDGKCLQNEAVVNRVAQLTKGTPLAISAVTLGEIEFGLRVRSEKPLEFEAELQSFVSDQLPLVLDVTSTTRTYYGSLRAWLFDRFAPVAKRRKSRRPEQLTSPVTGEELGIQENDLWIAAQALEYNLVFVTNDALARIQEIGRGLRVEDWTIPPEAAHPLISHEV